MIIDELSLRRRQLLELVVLALTMSTSPSISLSDEGDPSAGGEDSSQKPTRQLNQSNVFTSDSADPEDHSSQFPLDLGRQLGVSIRAPSMESADAPELLGELGVGNNRPLQSPQFFFNDTSNRDLLSVDSSPLETAGRSVETGKFSTSVVDALESVYWHEIGEGILDTVVDYAKDVSLERIADFLGTQATNRAFGYFSLVIDVIKPEQLNDGRSQELDYLDRLSPAERRDFFQEVFNRQIPNVPREMPPSGPTLRGVTP